MADVSIIICTRNRAISLATTLDSLELAIRAAPKMEVEVILVDNSSSDGTQDVIKRWAKSVPFVVLTLFEARPGLSTARNAGIRSASGAVLIFTDDDCALNSDYLITLERYYKNDVVPVVRGGRVELGSHEDLPFTIKLDDHAHQMAEIDHPSGFLIGANLTMHRTVIHQVGLFDERFGAGAPFIAAEDTDYIYRCYLHGILIEYVPDLTVKHFHGRKDRSSIARLYAGYHVGEGALYAKYFCKWHLLRHFYWDLRNCVKQLWEGTPSDNKMIDPPTSKLYGNIKGMLLYGYYVARAKIHRSEKLNDQET
jgi:glycosyltransferase involved in cell wall biosynthesis